MIFEYDGNTPRIDASAWVAVDATVSGNVTVGAGSRILHGARLIAESGGEIIIGENCIVLENAVLRATSRHNLKIGSHCLFGPNSHVTGCEIEDEVFIATGASVFHGAHIGKGAEVRINAVVHLKTVLEAGATVPIGWVAVGNPASIMSADRHEDIWAIQKTLDFPGFVYGLDRNEPDIMKKLTCGLSEAYLPHKGEKPV